MKITKIRLRSLHSISHGYGHEAVEIEADVADGEDVEQAIHDLRDRLASELRASLDMREAFTKTGRQRARAFQEIGSLERERDNLRQQMLENRRVLGQYDALRELAIAQGLPGADKLDGELPF